MIITTYTLCHLGDIFVEVLDQFLSTGPATLVFNKYLFN